MEQVRAQASVLPWMRLNLIKMVWSSHSTSELILYCLSLLNLKEFWIVPFLNRLSQEEENGPERRRFS